MTAAMAEDHARAPFITFPVPVPLTQAQAAVTGRW